MNLSKPQKLIYGMERVVGGNVSVICGSMLFPGVVVDTSKIEQAINEIYRINDAFRIRIAEQDGMVSQTIVDYAFRKIVVLQFENKTALDDFAAEYAKIPLDFFGDLSEFKIVLLPNCCGVLAKIHHIIGDAWTLSLIGNQINALLRGDKPEAYSYVDYLETEKAYLHSKRYEKDRSFFIDQFKRCDDVSYLSKKQNTSATAGRKTFVISSTDAKKVVDYAKVNNTSAFILFTAVFAVYMNRVKMNAERFYLGTAVLNRATEKEKSTAGMFVNTVPMLIELSNNQSFKENLSHIEDAALSAFRHQKYNYGDVLADLRTEYNFGEKLYDVIISYQNATVLGDAVKTTWYPCACQVESLQIHIDDRDNEGVFRIHYDYLIEKFSEQEIEMLHIHLLNLLFNAISDDHQKIYELSMLTADEEQKLFVDFNDTAKDYPKDKCVHTLFEEQTARTPDKVAVIACDKTLTYRELNEEANRIAHSLIEKGINVGDIVAFALPRRSYLISVVLGILKSGAAYLPIDPDYPRDRIDYMLKDSHAKLYITEESMVDFLRNGNSHNLAQPISSSCCFCCIYTSGSTGYPKGVLLSHRNFHNYFLSNVYIDLASNCKCVFCIANAVFDMFINEVFSALLFGLKLVLASKEDVGAVCNLAQLITENGIDSIICTPTKFLSYLNDTSFQSSLSNVSLLTFGGEALTDELYSKIKTCSNAIVINGYGPTETSIVSSYGIVDSDDITIGAPIANTQIYIVDSNLNPMPIGVTGELCIAGDGVGTGYLNRPELTVERFIDNPYGRGKLYKTGDLAYWREDGKIVYVGRNDFQVKIRGLRIELGEIESAIASVGGVSQSVAIVQKNDEGRQLVCAFYTGTEIDAKEIRSIIGKKLPKYMLPHIFTHLDKMPLTVSGKVNRKELPEVDLYAVETTVEYIAPQTDKEKALVSAIESILKIEKAGVADNFFDLGGDSLKAIELISKLEKAGYHTDTKTVFACDTIKELAEQLTDNADTEVVFEYPADIPATPAQMRVYTAQSMNADSTMYNVPYVFKATEVKSEILQEAINTLLDRHEILRTRFENKDGLIIQTVDENAKCIVEKLANDDILAFVRPFDLSKAPLIRVGIYENIVMIDMHHIITDGGSMPVFLRELNELYMGRTLGTTPVPYKRFAVTPQDHTESEEYWLDVYKDELPELTINTDFKRGQKQSFNGSAVYDTVDIELHNQIQKYCKKENITPFVFYMAAFNILLSKFSGCEDIVVGMPISGRDGYFLDTIGMFVNTIALRNKPTGTKTVVEFLQEVKKNSIAAIDHQDYPFGDLVKKLGLNTADRNPLFDVMFAYQSEQMTDVVFGDEKAELLQLPVTTSKYDFTLNILPRDNDVVIMAEYCTDLYKEKTIQRLIGGFKQLLVQMMNGKSIKGVSAVLPEEKRKLLYDFNDTAVDYPKDKCVHTLFEEQTVRTPDKVAVIACDKTLTYRELNEEANRIAHSLIEQGINVGDIVAFALPRRSYLISVVLGILKSGAAYLPVDPDYPQERIEYMLKDSHAGYFISESNIKELLSKSDANAPNIKLSSNNYCYCIYTSGSTGMPKGVEITHANVCNFVQENNKNHFQKLLLDSCEVIVGINSIVFDIVLQETLLPLVNGKTISFLSEEEIAHIGRTSDSFNNKPCGLIITPSRLSLFMEDLYFCNNLNNFKVIMCGAEPFPEKLVESIKNYTNAQIINGYGPTETTCGVTYCNIENNYDITIGKPIANTQIYIVDLYLNPTPIGVTGEICIAGDGVGAGYLNRPELTAEKFIDNPFGKGKLYKTGDLAYWRDDGNIVYVGRNDFQVKIRGLRIELGEIENALSSLEGVNQSVVIVRKDDHDRQLICCFYTGKELDTKEIRSAIGKKLPKYMLPHIITHVSEMPLTPSGKINRKALPDIDLSHIKNTTEYIAPVTEREKMVARILASILEVERIGLTDDFFELGGDSLKAIEFVSACHYEGIYFNLQSVFDHPTISSLLQAVDTVDCNRMKYDASDFEIINQLIADNTVDSIPLPSETPVGNILLAGATGYLGAHILSDFLEHDTGTAYCIVRGDSTEDCERRLHEILRFYFDDSYKRNNRIVVLRGDLTKERFGLSDEDYQFLLRHVDTVINSVASVKHYGSYAFFHETNVQTVEHLIDFCQASDAKLIHISTTSVAGNDYDNQISSNTEIADEKLFAEHDLYIGQPLDNVYVRSKFEAEKTVLIAMSEGLKANIMRMGNLTSRRSDGRFQKNYDTNAFLKRIKALVELGCIPDYLLGLYTEFTPIDDAASAVMTITRHFRSDRNLFHVENTNPISFRELYDDLNEIGISMKAVDGKTFGALLRGTENDLKTKHIYETFIQDIGDDDRLHYDSPIRIDTRFSDAYLRSFGFAWHKTDLEYITKYFAYFKAIQYIV